MQNNTSMTQGNEQPPLYSPMGQQGQNINNPAFQYSGIQNQNLNNLNGDINAYQFQSLNQQALNNLSYNGNLSQFALRNRIQNLGNFNPHNLNNMGINNYNQLNMMGMIQGINMGNSMLDGTPLQGSPVQKNWTGANLSNLSNSVNDPMTPTSNLNFVNQNIAMEDPNTPQKAAEDSNQTQNFQDNSNSIPQMNTNHPQISAQPAMGMNQSIPYNMPNIAQQALNFRMQRQPYNNYYYNGIPNQQEAMRQMQMQIQPNLPINNPTLAEANALIDKAIKAQLAVREAQMQSNSNMNSTANQTPKAKASTKPKGPPRGKNAPQVNNNSGSLGENKVNEVYADPNRLLGPNFTPKGAMHQSPSNSSNKIPNQLRQGFNPPSLVLQNNQQQQQQHPNPNLPQPQQTTAASTIPNSPVKLASNAVRYETNEHLQKRVALYRYKDDQYQKIAQVQHQKNQNLYLERQKEAKARMQLKAAQSQALITSKYRFFRPGMPVNASKMLQYDIEEGPVFFRSMPKLNQKLIDVANEEEVLVPIRLDLEVGGQRLCDAFTWNINDRFISIETFTDTLLKDLQLPVASFFNPVVTAIRDQIKDYSAHGLMIHKKLRRISDSSEVNNEARNEDDPSCYELRIIIKLEITVGRVTLEDQFEWDILNPNNSPELFAHILANDLGLGGEFRTAIAHSIREQIYAYHKSLSILDYSSGDMIRDPSLSNSFLPPLTQVKRDRHTIEAFTPSLVEISEIEMARQDKVRERESRRTRRQQRAGRRGALLPEREPIRTVRTLIKPKAEFISTPFPHGDPGALGGKIITKPTIVTQLSIGNNEKNRLRGVVKAESQPPMLTTNQDENENDSEGL